MPDPRLPGWPRALREDLAAAYVGLSASTFRAAVAPAVPAVRLSPGRVAWLRDDLDRWLDSRRDGPRQAEEIDADIRALAERLAAPAPSARRRKAAG